jgi:threonine synthase
MDKPSPYFTSLKCRECGRLYPKQAIHVCDFDFGPLEAAYDYDAIKAAISRDILRGRRRRMWRYRELLPIDGEPTIGVQVGFTPLVKAGRLAAKLGVRSLYIKNDTVNYPTLSFKDRVVSVALNRARELGFQTVACASTGNLANSVAANAASAGMKSYVLIPADLEQGKVLGSLVYGTNVIGIHGAYDQVNRLCSEIAGKYLLGNRGQIWMGLRECEPAALLRGRLEDDGLRDLRPARMAHPAAHCGSHGQRLSTHEDPQGLQ